MTFLGKAVRGLGFDYFCLLMSRIDIDELAKLKPFSCFG